MQAANSSAAGNGVIAFPSFGATSGGGLWTVGPDGRAQRRLPESPADPREPEYSRDGRYIAVALGDGSDRRLTVLSASTGRVVRQVPAEDEPRGDAVHCPALRTMSASKGRRRRTVVPARPTGQSNCIDLSPTDFSPDGARLLYRYQGPDSGFRSVGIDGRGTVDVVRLHSRNPALPTETLGSARFSPDGRFVVYTQAGRDKYTGIWVTPARGGKARRVSTGLSIDVAWAPAR